MNAYEYDFLTESYDVEIAPILFSFFEESVENGLEQPLTPLVLKLEDLDFIDWEAISSKTLGIMDPLGQLREWLAGAFSGFVDTIKKAFEAIVSPIIDASKKIWDIVSGIPDAFRKLGDLLKGVIVDPILKALTWVGENFPKILDMFKDLGAKVVDFITKLPSYVADFVSKTGALFADLASKIQEGFAWFLEQVAKFPETVKGFFEKVGAFFSDLVNKIQGGFAWFLEQVGKLPDVIKDFFEKAGKFFSDLAEKIKGGFAWFIEQVSKFPEFIKGLFEKAGQIFGGFVDQIKKGFGWFIDQVTKFPDLLRDFLEKTLGNVAKGVGGFVEWIRKGFEGFTETLGKIGEGMKAWFGEATKRLQDLGATFQGFVNAILGVPEKLKQAFEGVVKFFENVGKGFADFVSDPLGWLKKHILEPAWKGLIALGGMIWEGLKTVWDAIQKGVSWLWEQLQNIGWWLYGLFKEAIGKAGDVLSKIVESASKILEKVFHAILKPFEIVAEKVSEIFKGAAEKALKEGKGEAWFFMALALGSGPAMFLPALPAYALSTLPHVVEAIDGEIDAAPLGLGIKAKLKAALGRLVSWLGEAGKDFAKGAWQGFTIGLAMASMDPLKYVIRPAVKSSLNPIMQATFGVDAFFDRPSVSEIIEWLRRCRVKKFVEEVKVPTIKVTAPIEWDDAKKYGETILRLYGLPDKYTQLLTVEPKEFSLTFIDRFGAERTLPLGVMYDLPTHSELARMTQRDVFPGVDVMQAVASIRGWHPDITTLTYLMTFKYPSFEKLWIFYMRALSGMLWFKAPDTIKNIFDKEAEAVKAGKPISPLDLQKALRGPDQIKAFETALNVYFKWIEYSNFSWFTEKTEMYGLKVGQEIVSKLGGWTADSWLMIDIAADIPTKIDMRWMSRYGIFTYMAEKFEKEGVKFESYAPLVEYVPKLLEGSPSSQVQVDLTWFSKLLQATGLHPAWVPIVTVAENIMVISDEMTLLRTGWLNLFKEGMITLKDAEESLAGLIIASYKVGYWNPETKSWSSGWINLPVRWLPHERRLLELRMAMDRILDVYREVYGYIRSGVRTLALTPQDALGKLKELIGLLSEHYKGLTKAIVGKELELKIDESYATLWIEVQKIAQDIEAWERARAWWIRVSGWLLYRIAQGYVTKEELDELINRVKSILRLHPVEENAFREISEAIMGIVKKEAIPSPSTLATFAEYMVIPPTIIAKTLKAYNVPDEYWPLWIVYIATKPLKGDYKAVIMTALRALRYNAITYDTWKSILENAMKFGFTDPEINLLQLRAELELAIENAREYVPTPLTLASMVEYLPKVRTLIGNVLEARRIKGVWAQIWTEYVYLRPVVDEVRRWVTAISTLFTHFLIEENDLKKVFDILSTYGYEPLETTIIEKTLLAERARYAFNNVLGPPRTITGMARYSEKATDLAVTRAFKMIDALPIDDNTKKLLKEMWKQYVASYQAYPEIRSYETELINAFAEGAIDEKTFDNELDYLRKIGVPELRLAFVKRTAQLRRLRRALRGGS